MIVKSNSAPAKLRIIWCLGTEFDSQAISVGESPVCQAVYDHCSGRLATLHPGDTLLLARLQICTAAKRVQHQLVRRVSVPRGFRMCSEFMWEGQVLLYKQWTAEFGGTRIKRTEVLLVDSQTTKPVRKAFPYSHFRRSAKLEDSVLAVSNQKAGLSLFQVEF